MADYLKFKPGTRKHGARKYEAVVYVSRNFGSDELHSTHGVHKTWTEAAGVADREATRLNKETPRPSDAEMVEIHRRIQNQFSDRRS